MSATTIRANLAEIVGLASGAQHVYSTAPLLKTEADVSDLLGEGRDRNGQTLIRGWLVMSPEVDASCEVWATVNEYRVPVLGYWSMSDDGESTAQLETETVVSELMNAGVITDLAVPGDPAEVVSVATELTPAQLAGFSVWETKLTVTVREYVGR